MVDDHIESAGNMAIDIIAAIRKFKSEKNISLKADLARLVIECDEFTRKKIEMMLNDIKMTGKIKDIEFGNGDLKLNEKITIKLEM